jgi:hypothetical protein
MCRPVLAFAVVVFASCGGLRSSARRLPDGGIIGTAEGCNRAVGDGNRVLEAAEAPFANLAALAFDPQRNLYALNRTSSTSWISVFGPAPNNDYLRTLGRGTISGAVDFARAGDGTFWVLGQQSPATGTPSATVSHLGSDGALLERFSIDTDEASGIALASNGKLFVSAGPLAELAPDGGIATVFGGKDPYAPYYQGLAFDGRGNLWATELTERTVEEFNLSLGYDRLTAFGGHGSGPAMFDGDTEVHGGPSKIAIDANGDLYVNDPLGSRVLKLQRTGSQVGVFDFGGATNLDPIAIEPMNGNVYVGRGTGVDILCPL